MSRRNKNFLAYKVRIMIEKEYKKVQNNYMGVSLNQCDRIFECNES